MKYEIKIVHSHRYILAQMYQTDLRGFLKIIHLGWGDGSEGKALCHASVRTRVQISRTFLSQDQGACLSVIQSSYSKTGSRYRRIRARSQPARLFLCSGEQDCHK